MPYRETRRRTSYSELLLFACLFFTSCSLQEFARGGPATFADKQCEGNGNRIEVYIVNLGWHTGILMRSDRVSESLSSLLPEFAASPIVEIGWGDERFYRGSGYSIWSGIRAAFFSRSSALHVAGYASLSQAGLHHLEVVRLYLSQSGMERLCEKIVTSLARNNDGKIIRLGDSLYGKGSFYKAKGNFSISHTCNSWTSEAIQSAGCSIEGSRRASILMKQLTGKDD